MKKLSRLTALLLCLALLAGCGEKGSDSKSAAPVERHSSQRSEESPAPSTKAPSLWGSETDTPAPETPGETEAPAITPTPSPEGHPTPSPTPVQTVLQVRMTRQDSGDRERVLFEGLDAAGNACWQYNAASNYRTELTLIQEIGLWQDRYYFNCAGVVSCLRLSDGFLLWENGEFGGAGISSQIDRRNGNVYLCGWYGPDFFACNWQGETLSKFESVAGDFYWPDGMVFSGPDQLTIYYHGGAGLEMALPYYVDLTDFSISYYFGYDGMNADRQYWANIFLSDFIEQFKSNYPEDGGSDAELSSIARLFCKINRQSAIVYEDGYETVSLTTVNELCMRFFGRELHPTDGAQYSNQWGMQWSYKNGKFYFPAGDGEAYNRFAIATSYLRLPGGNVILSYDIYELDLDEYWAGGMDSKLYRMSGDEALSLAATGRIHRLGYGFAEVTPIEQSGHEGYYLLRLESWFS